MWPKPLKFSAQQIVKTEIFIGKFQSSNPFTLIRKTFVSNTDFTETRIWLTDLVSNINFISNYGNNIEFLHGMLNLFLNELNLIHSFVDISEKNINMDYINAGLVFPRNRDIDGKPILVLKSKLHVRGLRDTDQLLRNFIYWIERLNR